MYAETTAQMTRHRLLRWGAFCWLAIGAVLLVTAGALWQTGFDSHTWRPVLEQGELFAVVGVLLLACLPFTSREPMQRARWRYQRMFFAALLGCMVALAVLTVAVRLGLPTWAMALIALLPVAPMVWVVFATWRLTREGDELEQRIQLESVFITCGVAGLVAFAVGMLQLVDVVHLDYGLFYVLPAMIMIYSVANWWCRRRYGMRGCG